MKKKVKKAKEQPRRIEGQKVIRALTDYEVRVVSEEDRIIDFVASTEGIDRYNSRVKGWKVDNYLKNPVVLWAHNYDLPPIGRSLSVEQGDDRSLRTRIQFAPREVYEFAGTVYDLVKEGYIGAVSVGFIPGSQEFDDDDGVVDLLDNELLEVSVVPVPANPDALANAFRRGVVPEGQEELLMATRAGDVLTIEGEDMTELKTRVLEWYEEQRHVVAITEDADTVSVTFEKYPDEETADESSVASAGGMQEESLTSSDDLVTIEAGVEASVSTPDVPVGVTVGTAEVSTDTTLNVAAALGITSGMEAAIVGDTADEVEEERSVSEQSDGTTPPDLEAMSREIEELRQACVELEEDKRGLRTRVDSIGSDLSRALASFSIAYSCICGGELKLGDELDLNKALSTMLDEHERLCSGGVPREHTSALCDIRDMMNALIETEGSVENTSENMTYSIAEEAEPWDTATEITECTEIEDLSLMAAWTTGDGAEASDHHFIHHRAEDGAVVWKGIQSAMDALLAGATCKDDVTRKQIYDHLVVHYKEFNKQPPIFKGLDELAREDAEKVALQADERVDAVMRNLNEVQEAIERLTERTVERERIESAQEIAQQRGDESQNHYLGEILERLGKLGQ